MMPKQKICVISFDHWNYDQYIVNALKKKGVESVHIKIGGFKHKNLQTRLKNVFSKIFLGKNPKHIKRQDYILERLKQIGPQDQILVINPELIDENYHLKIKKHCQKYMAYLYDSVARCPVNHLLSGIFDEIYSFDQYDITRYNFTATSNYIYLKPSAGTATTLDYIYIGSIDGRINFLEKLGQKLTQDHKTFKFYAIGKKARVLKLKNTLQNKYKHIIFESKRLSQQQTLALYAQSQCIVDVVRQNQTGLSFRIFEAMALQKNILSNNHNLLNFDLAQCNKISIIDDHLNVKYQATDPQYPKHLLDKYSLNSWVERVFRL
jgi:hypothetical protein